jgi:hypothetical protein
MDEVGQLELSAIAAEFGLRITNARKIFDPFMPFRLTPLLGLKVWWRSNSWWKLIWVSPVEIARAGQSQPDSWDVVQEALSEEPTRTYRVSEIKELAKHLAETKAKAHASTLNLAEQMEFWKNYYGR